MPETIIKKRTSSAIRKSAQKRIKRQKAGRQPLQPAKDFDAVIAGSLSSLRLIPKGGAEIFYQDKNASSGIEIYNNLRACFVNALKITKKDSTHFFDPVKSFSIPRSIDIIISMFKKNIVPFDFDMEIRQDDNKFYFVIFKELDQYAQWNVIQIKPVVDYLSKRNKRLHDIFIEFLKTFMSNTGISPWFNWCYGASFDFIEEQVDEFDAQSENGNEPDMDVEYYTNIKNCLADYKSGKPATYKKLLSGNSKMSSIISHRLKELRSHGKNKKLIQAMIDGIDLIKSPYSIDNFCYKTEDKEDLTGLDFDLQFGVFWSLNDAYFTETEELINVQAAEGVFQPTIELFCNEDSKKIDLEWLRNGEDWPVKLSNYFAQLKDALNEY